MPNSYCVLCGKSQDIDVITMRNMPESTFKFSDKTIDLNIGECPVCGLVQLVNVPVSDDWSTVYRSIRNIPSQRESQKIKLKKFLNRYFYPQNPDTKFLEYGCGDGQYLEIFYEIGIECEGLHLVNQHKYNKYDCIFSFHVLEHVINPLGALSILYSGLNDNGILFIEVPNYTEIADKNIWLEFTRDHRCYFTKRTLSLALLKAGFDIEEIIEDGLCLTVIARKKEKHSLISLSSVMNNDIFRFNELIKSFNDEYVVVGAGHYTQVLLNAANIKPKYIYDSVPTKQGNYLCGVLIEPQENIASLSDCNNIIISCGIYNSKAKENIEKLVSDKNIICWE